MRYSAARFRSGVVYAPESGPDAIRQSEGPAGRAKTLRGLRSLETGGDGARTGIRTLRTTAGSDTYANLLLDLNGASAISTRPHASRAAICGHCTPSPTPLRKISRTDHQEVAQRDQVGHPLDPAGHVLDREREARQVNPRRQEEGPARPYNPRMSWRPERMGPQNAERDALAAHRQNRAPAVNPSSNRPGTRRHLTP